MVWAFELLFALLGLLFARNAYIGVKSGTVWAKGARYRRDESPILFWIALVLSAIIAAMIFGGVIVVAYMLISPSR